MEITTKSPNETQDFGKKVSTQVKAGDLIALYGDLGSGKTTFLQGLLTGLGVTQRITSPTFVFMKIYKTEKHTIFHFDLYRTESEADLKTLGLDELLADKSAIVVIEWAEKIGSLLPADAKKITFKHGEEEERMIDADWL